MRGELFEMRNRICLQIIKWGGEFTDSIILLTICILHALRINHYANFYPINGTFQNFNPVRRFLAGQIPYQDFTDYLGLGHLYMGSIFTKIFGGNYEASLIAFSFLTFLAFAIFALVIGGALFKNKKIVLRLTNILLVMLLIQPVFFENVLVGVSDIYNAVTYALWTGNSARFIRGLILPIIIILIILAIKKWKQVCNNKKLKDAACYLGLAGIIGGLSGFAFIWSNDYGISCWVSIILMFFAVVLKMTKRIGSSLIYTLIEMLSSVIGIIVFVQIFTLGNFYEWLTDTFGTGGYQGWYFQAKSFYLFEADFSYVMLLQAALCLAYLFLLMKKPLTEKSLIRYGIPAFANMVSFCAVNEYKLLSGGDSREVALSILFITCIFEIIRYFYCCRLEKFILYASLIVSATWIGTTLKDEAVFWFLAEKEGQYVEELGGNMTSLYTDLLDTQEYLGDSKFFSTYASAQEVMNGTYQPSGVDYNIHVLGDNQRENYMKAFRTEDFEYAATIQRSYTDWQYWNERSNWFFYSELYKYWHPVFGNTYELFWKRNENGVSNSISGNYEIEIVPINESSVKLILHTEQNITGIADVLINYQVEKKENILSKLLIRRVLKVENSGVTYANQPIPYESNYLRPRNEEYIPMQVTNGYGELTLTSCPEESTNLAVKSALCNEIITISYDDMEIMTSSLSDANWTNGIKNGNNSMLLFQNTETNEMALKNAAKLIAENIELEIISVDQDSQWITVVVNGDATELAYPQIIKIE